jgi:hypothetical protein
MLRSLIVIVLFSISFSSIINANSEDQSAEKAEALLKTAITAMGGDAYLKVKSERSRGYLTPFRENIPDKLATQTFMDYIVLPDKERVELKGQGRRFIQSNSGAQGWFYDSDSQMLREQSEVQRQRFVRGLRYQLDNIMRGWQNLGVRLAYLPRQELWTQQYGEGVILTYSDGEEVSLFFDLQTHLPIALRFPKEGEKSSKIKAENRFFKYLDFNGIKTPYVVDLYENGVQILRLNYEERSYNVEIPEKLFIKPENAKEIK